MSLKRKRNRDDEEEELLAQQIQIANEEHANYKKPTMLFVRAGTVNGDVETTFNSRETITITDNSSDEVNCNTNDNTPNIQLKDKKQNSYIEIMKENNGFSKHFSGTLGSEGNPSKMSKAIIISRQNSSKNVPDEYTTSNLYVQCLPPSITEEKIKETFGTYGPLTHIRILDNQRTTFKGNKRYAFVQFASRKDAERALIGINGERFEDSTVKISFATKHTDSVIIHYPLPLLIHKYKHESRIPYSANILPNALKTFYDNGNNLKDDFSPGFDTERYKKNLKELVTNSFVPVQIPENSAYVTAIHQLIINCIETESDPKTFINEIHTLANNLKSSDKDKEFFDKLFTYGTVESNYFIWKAFSIMNGDTFDSWIPNAYPIFKNGPIWIPPNVNIKSFNEMPECFYHTAYNFNKKMSTKNCRENGILQEKDKEELIKLINSGSIENRSIINLLLYCGDHTNEAKEIFKCLLSFLSNSKNHIILKIWFLISDLVSNYKLKGNKKFIKYFHEFEENYEEIVNKIKLSIDTTGDAKEKEELRNRALKVVVSWQRNEIFDEKMLQSISNKFYGFSNKGIDSMTNSINESKTQQTLLIHKSNDAMWKEKFFHHFIKNVWGKKR
uniref:RRM domain-containing protein n=1 Tax=Parastrongyloides trichosuri TaxID=131310 RepID=A0A0N4ZTH3_PARTI